MVPVELVLGGVAALGGVCTLLFGGGLLRQLFSHNAAMAVQKHELEQTKTAVKENGVAIKALEISSALTNRDIMGFQVNMLKLELIPQMDIKLNTLETLMGFLKDSLTEFRNERTKHDASK